MADPVATYSIGPAVRPPIHHDNGFLEKYPPHDPTLGDRASYAAWGAFLEAAEAGQKVPFIPHNNLPDALAAYRHFLYGKGTDRTFEYERYVRDDASGKITLENAIADVRLGAEALFRSRPPFASPGFQLTGTGIPCGTSHPRYRKRFPYPQTENWQKAIGAHWLWMSAAVTVQTTAGVPTFSVLMSVHVEDRYNFNPGAADINTGILDQANGRFELSGLARQYMNYSTVIRQLRWTGWSSPSVDVSDFHDGRFRMPGDNRRVRNRA